MASCAITDPDCAIGLIVGTGTNAAYIESAKNVKGLENTEEFVIINTEWGAFGDNCCIDKYTTEYDRQLDINSVNPSFQRYEKLISGMYLGEVVRLILLELIKDTILFEGKIPENLLKKNGFQTRFLTEIDRDPPHLFYSTEYILREEFKIGKLSSSDLHTVRYIASSVVFRGASLAGVGIACILNRMKRKEVTVGVDGSLFRFHPSFASIMVDTTKSLLRCPCKFRLKLAEDGSGKGAAAIVASLLS